MISSLQSLVVQQEIVSVNSEKIKLFVTGVFKREQFDKEINPIRPPVMFTSFNEEVNFTALLHLLSVGAEFENRASEAQQPSLKDVVLFGVLGSYLSSSSIGTSYLVGLSASDVSRLFCIPTMEKTLPLDSETGQPISCFSVETRGALAKYADLLTNTAVFAGRSLENLGDKDFASFIRKLFTDFVDTNEESKLNGEWPKFSSLFTVGQEEVFCEKFEKLVSDLVSTIISMDDRHFTQLMKRESTEDIEAEAMLELSFHKNARRLIWDIIERLKHADESLEHRRSKFGFSILAAPSCRSITTLFQMGILERKNADSVCTLQKVIDDLGKAGIGTVVAVRAGAVVACHLLADEINSSGEDLQVTPIEVSLYLDAICDESTPVFSPTEGGEKF